MKDKTPYDAETTVTALLGDAEGQEGADAMAGWYRWHQQPLASVGHVTMCRCVACETR